MNHFLITNPLENAVYKVNDIAILGEGYQFTGFDSDTGAEKIIEINGPSASGLGNYIYIWPSSVPSLGQSMAIGSISYNEEQDMKTVSLTWSSPESDVFSQIGDNLYNTSVGTPVGSNNFIAGVGAAATLQGSRCVVIGALSGSTNMENDNVIIGYQAMDSVTAFVAGANASNIAIGTGALDSGNGGVAGQNVNNVCIGEDAGTTLSTGSNNICIGISSDVSVNSATNQIIIGQGAIGKGDNTALIGNDSTTDVYLGARSNGAPPNMVLTGDNAGGSDFLYKIRAPSNASLNSQREWILPNNTPTANQVLTVSSVAAGPPNVATLGWSSISGLGVSSLIGTANQVLVNGTSGSAQIGACTLTLPQNIATTSTPTFSQLYTTSSPIADTALPLQLDAASSTEKYMAVNKAGTYAGLFGYSNGGGLGTGLIIRNVQSDATNIMFYVNSTTKAAEFRSDGTLNMQNHLIAFKAGDDDSHYVKYNSTLNGLELSGWDGLTFHTENGGDTERLRINTTGVNYPLQTASTYAYFDSNKYLVSRSSANFTSDVRSQFSAGTGVGISSGVISIGQAVATSSSPTFSNLYLTSSPISDTALPLQLNTGTGGERYFAINYNDNYAALIGFVDTGLGKGLAVRNMTSDPIMFITNNTTKAAQFDSSGNLDMQNHAVYLKTSDTTHGIQYSATPDGPNIFGLAGISNTINNTEIMRVNATSCNFPLQTINTYAYFDDAKNIVSRPLADFTADVRTRLSSGNGISYDQGSGEISSSAGILSSGTFNFTVSDLTDISDVKVIRGYFQRMGDIVYFSGRFDATPSGASNTSFFRTNLPVNMGTLWFAVLPSSAFNIQAITGGGSNYAFPVASTVSVFAADTIGISNVYNGVLDAIADSLRYNFTVVYTINYQQ